MKSLLIRISLLLLLALASTSCLTMMVLASSNKGNNLSAKTTRLQGKTFQKLSDFSALMMTERGEVVCVVAVFDEYYDGLTIKGRFKRGGIYEYTSTSGVKHYAPIYISTKDYKHLKKLAENLNPVVVPDEQSVLSI